MLNGRIIAAIREANRTISVFFGVLYMLLFSYFNTHHINHQIVIACIDDQKFLRSRDFL